MLSSWEMLLSRKRRIGLIDGLMSKYKKEYVKNLYKK